MKDHLRHHAKHMVIGGAVVLVLLLAAGVTVGEAARWALLLACPVGMIGMMWFMGRPVGRGVSSGQVQGPHDGALASTSRPQGVVPGGGPVVTERV